MDHGAPYPKSLKWQNPFGDPQGYANREVFTSPGFWQTFVNTLVLSIGNVTLTAAVPLILALAMNEIFLSPWKRFVQTIFYLPSLFSWVVVGRIWIFLLAPSGGIVNAFRGLFGLKPEYYLVQPALAQPRGGSSRCAGAAATPGHPAARGVGATARLPANGRPPSPSASPGDPISRLHEQHRQPR